MAATPSSPRRESMSWLKRKVITALERLVTISEEPFPQAYRRVLLSQRGRRNRSPFPRRAKAYPRQGGDAVAGAGDVHIQRDDERIVQHRVGKAEHTVSPRPRPGRPAVTKKLWNRSWRMLAGAKRAGCAGSRCSSSTGRRWRPAAGDMGWRTPVPAGRRASPAPPR